MIRLIGIAESNWWVIDGDAAVAGVDLLALPFRRFIAALYVIARRSAASRGEDELKKWESWLMSPLQKQKSSDKVASKPSAPAEEPSSQFGGLLALRAEHSALRGGGKR